MHYKKCFFGRCESTLEILPVPRHLVSFGLRSILILFALAMMGAGSFTLLADDWRPITTADLALKTNPASPGDHAMILYREVSLDDVASTASEYRRIKILDEKGKDYGDLEILYGTGTSVKELHARTILPDGTVVNFGGKTYDRVITKSGGERVMARTLTLPNVQTGCIVEYHYTIQLDPRFYYVTDWDVQEDLFTRDAVFTFRPYPGLSFYTRASHLPEDARPLRQKDNAYRMELHNIGALAKEDLMPPEDDLRGQIEFFYRNRSIQTTDQFWKDTGKQWSDDLDKFAGGHKDQIQQEVNRVVAADDSADVKLQKLYDRAQKIRNLTLEPERTVQEEKREKLKANNNAGDVLKNGYGTERDINFLYVAMVRAAGMDATEIYLAPRNRRLFNPDGQETRQLAADIIDVRRVSGDVYLDPSCGVCPYGLLPWYETATRGIKLDHSGGQIVSTPPSKPADALLVRHADLNVVDDGTLRGTFSADFQGIRAIQVRERGQNEDEVGREKSVGDDVRDGLPPGSQFKVTSMSGWEKKSGSIRVQGDVELAGAAVPAGRRLLVTIGPLQAGRKPIFQEAQRIYPIYYQYPFVQEDDVVVHFPANLHVDSLPNSLSIPAGAANYNSTVRAAGDGLLLTRSFSIDGFLFSVNDYPSLQNFYAKAHQNDEQQVVLIASPHP